MYGYYKIIFCIIIIVKLFEDFVELVAIYLYRLVFVVVICRIFKTSFRDWVVEGDKISFILIYLMLKGFWFLGWYLSFTVCLVLVFIWVGEIFKMGVIVKIYIIMM